MTEQEFNNWYEFVNDSSLKAAAYTGLVDLPAEIERLTRELREEREVFLSRQLHDTAEIERLKSVIEEQQTEITRLESINAASIEQIVQLRKDGDLHRQ